MTILKGQIRKREDRQNKNNDPYISFKLAVSKNDQYGLAVNDHDLLAQSVQQGDWVNWEVEENEGSYRDRETGETKPTTFRHLVAILDTEISVPDVEQRYDQPSYNPSDRIDGMIWGAVAHDAAALLGPNLPKPEPFDSEGKGLGTDGVVWPDDEWLAMAALCQDRLTRMLYDQRPSK